MGVTIFVLETCHDFFFFFWYEKHLTGLSGEGVACCIIKTAVHGLCKLCPECSILKTWLCKSVANCVIKSLPGILSLSC